MQNGTRMVQKMSYVGGFATQQKLEIWVQKKGIFEKMHTIS